MLHIAKMEVWSQCHFEGCFETAEWCVEGTPYCTTHKEMLVQMEAEHIAELERPPVGANDEDLALLELIRQELDWGIRSTGEGRLGSRATEKVVFELDLPNTLEGWDLASWYLWKMGLISIEARDYVMSVHAPVVAEVAREG